MICIQPDYDFYQEVPSSGTAAFPAGLIKANRVISGRLILIQQIENYFKKTHKGRTRASLLIPEPLFVHSDLTTGVQSAGHYDLYADLYEGLAGHYDLYADHYGGLADHYEAFAERYEACADHSGVLADHSGVLAAGSGVLAGDSGVLAAKSLRGLKIISNTRQTGEPHLPYLTNPANWNSDKYTP